jgi:hypothetical protein
MSMMSLNTPETATTPTYAAQLAIWKKGDAKSKSLILDGIKDHVIPHLSGKNTAKDMWKALSNLYQRKNENMIIVLRDRLRGTKMAKGKGVVPYLTRIMQIKDEFAVVDEKIEESELVLVALNGFSKS